MHEELRVQLAAEFAARPDAGTPGTPRTYASKSRGGTTVGSAATTPVEARSEVNEEVGCSSIHMELLRSAASELLRTLARLQRLLECDWTVATTTMHDIGIDEEGWRKGREASIAADLSARLCRAMCGKATIREVEELAGKVRELQGHTKELVEQHFEAERDHDINKEPIAHDSTPIKGATKFGSFGKCRTPQPLEDELLTQQEAHLVLDTAQETTDLMTKLVLLFKAAKNEAAAQNAAAQQAQCEEEKKPQSNARGQPSAAMRNGRPLVSPAGSPAYLGLATSEERVIAAAAWTKIGS